MKTKRVLITGSRGWHDAAAVRGAIAAYAALHSDCALVVVHGDCSSGADRIARDFCAEVGFEQEKHAADWDRHGRSAGFRRNAEMAAAGADEVLAFWDGESRGTEHMIRAAAQAGIPVRIVGKRR